jgi:hypothetical protein
MTVQPGLTCLHCHAVVDQATELTDSAARPVPGSVGICQFCGNLAIYVATSPDGVLGFREPSSEEINWLLDQPEVQQILAVRARVMGQDPQSLAAGGA